MNGCHGTIGHKTKTVLWHKENLSNLLEEMTFPFIADDFVPMSNSHLKDKW